MLHTPKNCQTHPTKFKVLALNQLVIALVVYFEVSLANISGNGRPPQIPVDRLRLQPVTARAEQNNVQDRSPVVSGRAKETNTNFNKNPSPIQTARSAPGSSRDPSTSLSARRALEEKRMEIESVRGLC